MMWRPSLFDCLAFGFTFGALEAIVIFPLAALVRRLVLR